MKKTFLLSVVVLIMLLTINALAQKSTKPRDRIAKYNIKCDSIKGVVRNYVFDSLYASSPSTNIAYYRNFQEYETGYMLVEKELKYLGRTNKNTIQIEYINKIEASSYSVADEKTKLDIFIESPNSASIISIGGSVESPSFLLVVTLDGSNLYYKFIGDGLCLYKK